MDCPSIPQFSIDFLLRSKLMYLKEHPPSVSIANREFTLSSLLEDVMKLVYKLQLTLLHSGLH